MRPIAAILEKAYPSTMVESEPSSADVAAVQKILDDPKMPATAEKGMAYVVHWADGRGIFAVRRKESLRKWLKKTGEMAEIVSIKYGKAEHKGEALKVETREVTLAKGLLIEAVFTAKDIDLDKTYGTFKASYEKQTGKAWDKTKFLERIANWTLYGEHDGFVAGRKQASGPIKLVGAAGNPIGVKKGFQELLAQPGPVWGAMDLRLATMAARMGMKMPPAWIMSRVLSAIKDKFAAASGLPAGSVQVNKDGSLTIDYPDVGKATKFVVGNKAYFEWLLKTQGALIPAMLRTAISYFLTTGKPPPEPKDQDQDEAFAIGEPHAGPEKTV